MWADLAAASGLVAIIAAGLVVGWAVSGRRR